MQSTIPPTEDDWSIARFSLLHNYLAVLVDEAGEPLCQVVSRDRTSNENGDDPILSTLDRSQFDELWLFAVDTGNGLSPHHFYDYNWDSEMGCSSFVDVPPGNNLKSKPDAIDDLKAYLRNLVLWLAPAD